MDTRNMNGSHHEMNCNGHLSEANMHLGTGECQTTMSIEGEKIISKFNERYTLMSDDETSFKNVNKQHIIETDKRIPKLGVMLVGIGGNNGSTFVAGVLANKKKMEWETKQGTQKANFYGSFT